MSQLTETDIAVYSVLEILGHSDGINIAVGTDNRYRFLFHAAIQTVDG
jgi:hypothetical protein